MSTLPANSNLATGACDLRRPTSDLPCGGAPVKVHAGLRASMTSAGAVLSSEVPGLGRKDSYYYDVPARVAM